MTTIDPIAVPTISEEQSNSILDEVVQSVIVLHDDDGTPIDMPVTKKLAQVFGGAAPVVAQLVLLGALRGFEEGLVTATSTSDRTDILAAALRKVHVKEMFGDCEEDGEPWPCRTARALDLVAGKIAEPESDPDAELEALA